MTKNFIFQSLHNCKPENKPLKIFDLTLLNTEKLAINLLTPSSPCLWYSCRRCQSTFIIRDLNRIDEFKALKVPYSKC